MASSNGRRILLNFLLRCTPKPQSLPSPAHPLPRLHTTTPSSYTASLKPGLNSKFLGLGTSARHFSWWRWGGSNPTSQQPSPEHEAFIEKPASREAFASTSFPQEDENTSSGNNPHFSSAGEVPERLGSGEFPWQEDAGSRMGAAPLPTTDLQSVENVPTILDTAGVVESSSFWSVLQAPVDVVVGTLDGFHNATGVPWWLTIVGSTLALRAALFPLTVTQLQKASLLARLGSQLPSPVPAPGSGQSLASQYRIFTKRRLELGAPSPAWLIAVPLVQIPLFILWIVAVRQMAMAAHPGFENGGILWFTDLTVPVQGALGSLFPTIVAVTYFTNLQLSFKGMERQKGAMGTLMKFYKWWLEAATIPAFIFGFYLPQGVFMHWITNNCCSLAQTVALRQSRVRAALGLPSLTELAKLRTPSPPPPSPRPGEGFELKMEAVQNMSADDLLVLAANCVSMQKEDEALQVLHFTVDKFPDKAEALFALGKIYTGRQQWSEASEYHGLVLRKTKEKELLIAASLGAGVALFNLGKRTEAIKIMSVITEMDVPPDPLSQHRYFRALVTLGSVMSQEGLKVEALALLKKAAKYEPMVEKVLIPQLEEELRRKA